MLEAKARIIIRPNGGTGTLYIPAGVVNDSSFPFSVNDRVIVRIRGKRLIVEKDREIPEKNKSRAKYHGSRELE